MSFVNDDDVGALAEDDVVQVLTIVKDLLTTK
jgi:hypothetical protein